jgi:hypothetical protein
MEGDYNAPLDTRNAVLLLDENRRRLLAQLDPGVGNSFATLYKRFRWGKDACARRFKETGQSRWKQAEERWFALEQWLDMNLEMTSAVGGLRSKQLVQAITAERGSQAGAEVFFQMSGAEPKKAEKQGWLFKR